MREALQFLRAVAIAVPTLLVNRAEASYMYINVDAYDYCGNSTGAAHIQTNAPGPLTILWSTGATTNAVTGLAAGQIWVNVTDGQGTFYTDTAEVFGYAQLPSLQGFSYIGPAELYGYIGIPCSGQCNAAIAMPTPQLLNTTPLSFTFDAPSNYLGMESTYGFPVYSGFCEGATVNYTYTDVNGCMGSGSLGFGTPFELPPQVNVTTTDYCANGAMGTAQINTMAFTSSNTITLYKDGNYYSNTGGIWEFDTLTPGNYTGELVLYEYGYDGNLYGFQCGQSLFYFTIYDLGPDCGKVEGDVWYDEDSDCNFDAAEHGMNGTVLNVGGYPAYVSNGHYAINLPAGNYLLSQTDPYVVPICPAVQPVPFTVNANITTIDLANWSTEPMDVSLQVGSGVARPGFNHSMYGAANNFTPQPTGPVTVICDLDADVEYVSAIPTPIDVSGNTVTWELPDVSYFGSAGFSALTFIPATVPLGTDITHSCTASNPLPEVTLANNTAVRSRVTQGSFDPNDKSARTSSGWSDTQYFINEDEWIDYTIRFQNTGTDTAFTVVITDTLDSDLDMNTFEQGASSHPVEVAFRTGRVVEWTFNDILLPDSNINEAQSHGLVTFRIRPIEPLLPGTIIANQANIFFDFNPPVITEPSVLTVETSTSITEAHTTGTWVAPNPVSDVLHVLDPQLAARTAEWMIMAADGRLVLRGTGRSLAEGIGVSTLPDGVYTLRLSNGQVHDHITFIKLARP